MIGEENDETGDERTVFSPKPTVSSSPAVAAPAPPPAPPPLPAPTPASGSAPTSFGTFAPRLEGNRIQVGDVLNHIFEVKSFIARGGMGEVFEGVNVNTDERVAIKVMLPALAADANVVAMFRKEARTLTRLAHPALVSYRVLAQEPQLGVLYIVTEFVDGRNLADVLASVPRSVDSLVGLTRRLADGLRVAHDLGAVHRDISPDNILLESGRIDQAKIIDFGIAKDLDPSKATIVGDGFAGKLNYVAPEQLGDFNREVGPWSDVYSLALVILAIAMGRDVDMGGSLVDAVDKRRAGPDLSVVPSGIRPVLEAMLQPNPANRLRSMAEVIAALDVVPFAVGQQESKPGPTPSPSPSPQPSPSPSPPPAQKPASPPAPSAKPVAAKPAEPAPKRPDAPKAPRPPIPKPAIFGGIAVIGVILLAVIGVYLFGGTSKTKPTAQRGEPATTTRLAPGVSPIDAAQAALTKVLPGISCSWIDIQEVKGDTQGVSVILSGVAGSPVEAQAALDKALKSVGVASSIDIGNVVPVEPTYCDTLNAYRPFKADRVTRLSVDQAKFEMAKGNDAASPNEELAKTNLHIALGKVDHDFALLGLESDGSVVVLGQSRTELSRFAPTCATENICDLNGLSGTPGTAANLLIVGKGPFDKALLAPPLGARGADWATRLNQTAQANGWKAEFVWFKIANEQPN